MYRNWLYLTTPDAHLVCLDAKDGSVRWIVELADPKLGYFSTMAPLVIRDHVIVGVSGTLLTFEVSSSLWIQIPECSNGAGTPIQTRPTRF